METNLIVQNLTDIFLKHDISNSKISKASMRTLKINEMTGFSHFQIPIFFLTPLSINTVS